MGDCKRKKSKIEFLINLSRNSGQRMPAMLLAEYLCLFKETIRSYSFHLPPLLTVGLGFIQWLIWGGGEGRGSSTLLLLCLKLALFSWDCVEEELKVQLLCERRSPLALKDRGFLYFLHQRTAAFKLQLPVA